MRGALAGGELISETLLKSGQDRVIERHRHSPADDSPAPENVAKEFERLKALAREQGLAVAIGHPYPETLAFLERAIPDLVEEGIQLVPLRELIDFP